VSLTEVRVDNVRCIEHAQLRLHPGQNLISGGNGSGKTSLLEAIFLLGRGRSFRTRNSERLIRHGEENLVVFGKSVSFEGERGEAGLTERDSPRLRAEGHDGGLRLIRDVEVGQPEGIDDEAALRGESAAEVWGAAEGRVEVGLGVQVSRHAGTTARIGGAAARSLTELTQAFPVQVIDPGIHKLLEEGGHRRRRWLDWGVFHVEQQFGEWWARYTRAVKQRNAALRVQPEQAAAWDSEVARLGELIGVARERFLTRLLPYWRESVVALSGLEPELHYFRGWAQDVSLGEALEGSRARDQAKRLTHVGPHRGDVLVRLSGRPAREILSRGQQKLVAVAMTLAQLNLLQSAAQMTSTLLLDDPAAELDGHHVRVLIEQVMRLRSQLVLTSLHTASRVFGTPDCVFHVERGRVQSV
jgi:DNA replication and repair protein RecF